jgi:hypothetical protein
VGVVESYPSNCLAIENVVATDRKPESQTRANVQSKHSFSIAQILEWKQKRKEAHMCGWA